MEKKYVVVCCSERMIFKVGQGNSYNEAYEIMKNDFLETYENMNGCTDDIEWDKKTNDMYTEDTGEYCLEATMAYINGSNSNVDWDIIEVDY